jgi:hypothetical protein
VVVVRVIVWIVRRESKVVGGCVGCYHVCQVDGGRSGQGGVVRGWINTGLFSLASLPLGLRREMRLSSLFLFEGDFGVSEDGEYPSSSWLEEASDHRDSFVFGTPSFPWSCI